MKANLSINTLSLTFAEIAANGAHVLIGVACVLLERQMSRLAADFEADGGFSERLYRVRRTNQKKR